MLRPVRLRADNFHEEVTATLYALVRVDRMPRFDRGVPEFFEARYPQLFSFGLLARSAVRDPGFWTREFRTSVGPVRRVSDGYFLFEAGLVVGYHTGSVREQGHGGAPPKPGEVELLIEHAFGGRTPRPHDLERARQLVAYLDEIVQRKQRSSGWSDDGPQVAPDPEPRRAPRPAVRSDTDPFQIIGVEADATDAQIRTAYKEQMKLNHPDKVAHLSPALQEFAQVQTLAIKAAYDAIMAMRRR